MRDVLVAISLGVAAAASFYLTVAFLICLGYAKGDTTEAASDLRAIIKKGWFRPRRRLSRKKLIARLKAALERPGGGH